MRDNNTKYKKSFIVMQDGVITKLSKEFIKLIGYDSTELVGKSCSELDKLLRLNPQNKFKDMDYKLNVYLFTKLLEPRDVTISLEMDKNRKCITYFFEEKEDSCFKSKLLYAKQLILDNNSRMAIYSASELVLLKANEKYIDYLNEPLNKKENCIGKRLDQIVSGFRGSELEEIWKKLINNGETFYKNEFMYDIVDVGITYWDLSVVPIMVDGKAKFLVENSIEVTERVVNRKLGEEQRNQLESIIENVSAHRVLNGEKIKKYNQVELLKKEAGNANNAKSIFLANMSHEIRTPLNGILVTTQLLSSTSVSIEQSKYIKMLKDSSDILLKMINNILDISRIESGIFKLKNEPFSLLDTINSIYNNLLTTGNLKGLEVSFYFDPAINCDVIGDELRLRQILENLISNAVKFTERGYISFRISQISSDSDYENIEFTIKDTGIGIEESFKEKIFTNFNQGDISVSKKYMGTGLGLSISKQLARLMNGELSFESITRQGSTFCFKCKMKNQV